MFVLSLRGVHQRTLDGTPLESIRERSVDASNSTQWEVLLWNRMNAPVSIRERSVDASGPILLSSAPDILVLFALYHFFG